MDNGEIYSLLIILGNKMQAFHKSKLEHIIGMVEIDLATVPIAPIAGINSACHYISFENLGWLHLGHKISSMLPLKRGLFSLDVFWKMGTSSLHLQGVISRGALAWNRGRGIYRRITSLLGKSVNTVKS